MTKKTNQESVRLGLERRPFAAKLTKKGASLPPKKKYKFKYKYKFKEDKNWKKPVGLGLKGPPLADQIK